MASINYTCKTCGQEASVDERAAAPICCGIAMQPKLEPCTSPAAAEARSAATVEDVCDDGVH